MDRESDRDEINGRIGQQVEEENGSGTKSENDGNSEVEQEVELLENDGKVDMKDENTKAEDGDMMCGIGNWKPRFLQIFARKHIAICLFCAANFLFSFSFSIFIAAVTTIQKRYALKSVYIGLCATLFDTATLLAVLPVAYFAGRPDSHRPRVIGVGLIVGALSLCSVSLTHFASEPYNYSKVVVGSNQTSVCSGHYGVAKEDGINASSYEIDCSSLVTAAESESIQATVLLLLGHMVAGICFTPSLILTPAYIDDAVGKVKSPLILGIYFACFTLGPVAGFPFSSIFLELYVDIGRVNMSTIELTPKDPRWVGAWWLGFIVESVLIVMIAIPIIFLPKRFPPPRSDGDGKEQVDVDACDTGGEAKMAQEAFKRMKDFPRAIRRLFSNVALVSTCIGFGLESAIMSGLMTYITKYTEEQFRITASYAANVTGISIAIPTTLGIFVGGYMIRRMKWSPATLAKFVFIITVLTCIIPIPLLFMGCETDVFAGATLPYNNGHVGINSTTDGMVLPETAASSPMSSTCNENCECTESEYNPVCGSDGVTYYSPCFAGCTEAFTESNFSSCGCIGEAGTDGSMGQFGTAISGSCGKGCNDLLIIFLIIMFIMSAVSSLPGAAYMVVPLRVVEPRDKPFALGVKQLFAQLIGFVPTPLYMGYIIDSACVVWGTSECSDFGNCWVYDLVDYRTKLITFQVVLKALAIICFMITWLSLRNKERKAAELTRKDPNAGKPLKDIVDL